MAPSGKATGMSPAAGPREVAGQLAGASPGPFPVLGEIAELPLEAVATAFHTDLEEGLSDTEARARLRQVGPNDPAPETGLRWPGIALRQLSSKLLWLLIAAMLISMGLGEWLNAFAIGITVVIAAAFGFFTEYRSERAAAALRSLTAQRAEVVREGLHEEIPATDVVPGDLVALGEGRIVPADGRVVLSQGLLVNEAILTGESVAVAKTEDLTDGEALRPPTVVYGGTTVVAGSGLALVAATGAASALGSMVTAMRTAERPPTPLEARLEVLGKRLIAVFLALCALLPVIGFIQGREARPMVELAVALAIGAVPEGLPAVATAALAVAVHRLAARKVLVRRLEAVETLGSATTIATDKTGTLTLNRMVLRAVVLPGGEAVRVRVDESPGALKTTLAPDGDGLPGAVRAAAERALVVGALCSDAVVEWDSEHGWHAHGDPSEAAIRMAAQGLGWGGERLDATWPRVATEPFTAATRLMRTTHGTADGTALHAIKGAYEQVAARSASVPADLQAAATSFAETGHRVFA
ncbi:MAG: cation-transporting P-type ATPase, partial [Dehalococcoidia bacterium]|nr:cation-transporting P-type ATPase [Dehalococcoidia bacterium]